MSEIKDVKETKDEKKTLSLGKGTLSLKGGSGAAAARPTGTKGVAVEVRNRRRGTPAPKTTPQDTGDNTASAASDDLHNLTEQELERRARVLVLAEEEAKRQAELAELAKKAAEEAGDSAAAPVDTDAHLTDADKRRQQELEELRLIQEEEDRQRQETEKQRLAEEQARGAVDTGFRNKKDIHAADAEEEESFRERMKKQQQPRPNRGTDNRRRSGKITVTQVLNEDYDRDRGPSLAAQRRAREKARMAASGAMEPPKKQSREIIVPEAITVQELANRMAERSGDVIKALMKLGVMATINQSLDADTAELIIEEFGHKIKRVTDADVEEGLEGLEDQPEDMLPRPPVVTVMGHVDHGKTSLLDALRTTDVVSGEAGGITQHIGAYQVTMSNGSKITFLDTPGHAAFTEMRARGANVTDIVVLVVAANDSIMPQTIEAINHAKAAGVPLIVAVNKVDLPDADPKKVKQDLLQYEVIVEDFHGETQCIEISAKQRINLDKLEEAILLQAEMLEIKANPNRDAVGAVVEAKMEQGRGNVATVLVQKGTLKIGDIFVVGSEWGRVRALVDDHGKNVTEAVPGQPVEILGLNGAPQSGDHLVVVADEGKAREISEYRQRKKREAANALQLGKDASFEELLAYDKESKREALSILIKADVHGSVEAIAGSLEKLVEENEELKINILHSGVGGITESDVILAKASNALIVGFNVRANTQAREMAEKNGVDIRYYNVIYNVIDDAKAILSGMLAPALREEYLGQAEIRQVFRVTKVGNIAGCMVTRGMVKRGAKVRLLRDDVVIHEGTLKTLKRFKDEVKEVKEGMECGMAFENYDDIKEHDIIECYEVVEEARTLD
ncbi:MAG: translation initiation factor IF-2 [Rhodospirillales bacterium]|nr:translation initiation factor IF-2 [Rhodospirillales bacterium]